MSIETIFELVLKRVSEAPHKTAFRIYEGHDAFYQDITYAALYERAIKFSTQIAWHASKGDRIVLLCQHGLEFIVSFLGCLRAGIIPVPSDAFDSRENGSRLEAIISDAKPALTLVSSSLAERFRDASVHGVPVQSFESIANQLEQVRIFDEGRRTEISYIQYTSGSTSVPRGTVLSHENVLSNLDQIDRFFCHSEESVIVSWLPHFHDMGLVYGILEPLYCGVPGVLLSPSAFIRNPKTWLQCISDVRATHSGGPNFAYDHCVRRIPLEVRAELNLRSWRVAFSGAERVRKETLDRFASAFACASFNPSAFYPAYGLAEATLKVTCRHTTEPLHFKRWTNAADGAAPHVSTEEDSADGLSLVCCGRPSPDTDVRIVDPTTFHLLQPGELGEIWVSGPSVALGYWNQLEETSSVFGGQIDGVFGEFLRTGDIGFIAEEGLYITGRLKDLIILRGKNHHPEDIEATIQNCDPRFGGLNTAAFGVDDGRQEEMTVVQEVRNSSATVVEETIRIIRASVAEKHGAVAHRIVLVRPGRIPKTSSGKVRRSHCRALLLEGNLPVIALDVVDERSATGGDEIVFDDRSSTVGGKLIALVRKVMRLGGLQIDPEASLVSMGLDSLSALELQAAIEETLEVSVPIERFMDHMSVRGLEEVVGALLSHPVPANLESSESVNPGALSFSQERLWFVQKRFPNTSALNIAQLIRLGAPIDVPALVDAMRWLVDRHESLRAGVAIQNGMPRLHYDHSDVPLVIVPLVPEDTFGEASTSFISRPFDLTGEQLWRCVLLQDSADGHDRILVVFSHLIADAWSAKLFAEELLAKYVGGLNGDRYELPLAASYSEFNSWHRHRMSPELQERQMHYWESILHHPPQPAFVRSGAAGKDGPKRALTLVTTFSENLSSAIRECARTEDATLFVFSLAACYVLLSGYTSQSDIIFSTAVNYRANRRFRRTVGCLANRVAIRINCSPGTSFREIVERTGTVVREAQANCDLPFGIVQTSVQGSTSNAKLDVLSRLMFHLEVPANLPSIGVNNSTSEFVSVGETFFDFLMVVEDSARLKVNLIVAEDVLSSIEAEELLRSYEEIMIALCKNPEVLSSDIRVCGANSSERFETIVPKILELAIASNFTHELLLQSFRFWMENLGWAYNLQSAPYNQLFQELLTPNGLIRSNRQGINVVLIQVAVWANRNSSKMERLNQVRTEAARFISYMTANAALGNEGHFVVGLCPSPDPDDAAFYKEVETQICVEMQGLPGTHVFTPDMLLSRYPVSNLFDSYLAHLADIPYSDEASAAIGTMIARVTYWLCSKPKKVIVVDCDNTLWSGVCGEDGPEGVVVDDQRKKLQQFLIDQSETGMLLCLVSKNHEQDVMRVFECHPGMLLQPRHIVAQKINWASKAQNILDLQKKLQVGLDSFIFLDDSPVECAEVQAALPDVLTLCLPSTTEEVDSFLHSVWEFDHFRVTNEDRQRPGMYRQQWLRKADEDLATSLDAFLESLNLRIQIRDCMPSDIPRVNELIRRTNQFTLNGRQWTETELMGIIRGHRTQCLAVEASDRFGDYGLIGAVVMGDGSEGLTVTSFVLSCRALGKRIENHVLEEIGRRAQINRHRTIVFEYQETTRNKPFQDFLKVWCDLEHPALTLPLAARSQNSTVLSTDAPACASPHEQEARSYAE